MTNKELASQILEHIGGEENITFLTHCATRIRLNLKDDNKADVKVLSRLEGIITAQNKSGQLQVVIGAKVNAVYEELEKMVKITDLDVEVDKKKNKKESYKCSNRNSCRDIYTSITSTYWMRYAEKYTCNTYSIWIT